MNHLDQILAAIAREHLLVPTLKTRRNDSLDFHDVAVWQLKLALEAAFNAGAQSAPPAATLAPGLPYALHRLTCTVPAGCFAQFPREKPISRRGIEYVGQPLDYNHRLSAVIG
jgi:hypothetical protein